MQDQEESDKSGQLEIEEIAVLVAPSLPIVMNGNVFEATKSNRIAAQVRDLAMLKLERFWLHFRIVDFFL